MNPLQKKCVIATASCHLLLLLILILGPGFFRREPPPPVDLPMLKVIPLRAIDEAFSSGVAHATPPPPAPPTPVSPPPEPVTVPPKPLVTPEQVQPPKPEVTPEPVQPPKPVEPVIPEVKPTVEPSPLPVKPKPSRIEVDLTPVKPKVTKTHETHADTTARDEERSEREAERKRALAVSRITGSLAHNLSSSTEVDMPGDSTVAYANYGQIVKSMYEQAWIPPDNADNDEASPKVHVVIARDGTVISAHITEPSGDAAVDASVRRVLDRVRSIQPFPEGATEKERSYYINFNLKAKRMLE